jgi:hypothetical protein
MMIEERGVGASLDINNVKIRQDGDFLLSSSLPHFYEHNPSRRRKRRLPDDS